MKQKAMLVVALAAALATAVVAGVAMGGGSAAPTSTGHMHGVTAASPSAADLRVSLNRLLGEHALLAIQATQAGYSGQKNFPALGRSLDRNSVELANAIGSVYGKQARQKFLNGKFMWRDHIRFFVDYTVGLAGKNKARQNRAVGNLKGYIEAFSSFLATATGLPKSALRASITMHVMQLKGQLDAYAKGQYGRSYTLTRSAYKHMGMTGDVLSGAIAKKFPNKFR